MFLTIAIIIINIVLFDQLTKLFLMDYEFVIIPRFLINEPQYNDGAAFSSFSGARWFFIIFTILALGFMFYLLISEKWSKHKLFKITMAIMIGGVIGNLIDRIVIGAVRDFIYLPTFNFICNVSDIAITVACIMFIVYLFFIKDNELKTSKSVTIERNGEIIKNTKEEK